MLGPAPSSKPTCRSASESLRAKEGCPIGNSKGLISQGRLPFASPPPEKIKKTMSSGDQVPLKPTNEKNNLRWPSCCFCSVAVAGFWGKVHRKRKKKQKQQLAISGRCSFQVLLFVHPTCQAPGGLGRLHRPAHASTAPFEGPPKAFGAKGRLGLGGLESS